MVILLALAAAVLYGSGDFLGGAASRGGHVLSVLLLSSPAGAAVVLIAAAVAAQPAAAAGPAGPAGLAWGAAAGAVGGTGLVIFLAGLAAGPMNVVAPVSGLVSTILPVGVALAGGERPHALVYPGAAACLVAIVLASAGPGEPGSRREAAEHGAAGHSAGGHGAAGHGAGGHGAGGHGAGGHGAGGHGAGGHGAGRLGRARAVAYGVVSGAAFGAFFLFLHDGTGSGALWPVAAARLAEVAIIAIAAAAVRPGWLPGMRGGAGGLGRLNGRLALAAVGYGVIDAIANICYAEAARAGMLGLAVVLTSLYPGVTVLLARLVLGERLRPVQQAGLGLAALGILLVTI